MIQIVIGTNFSETKEFLSNYVLTFPIIVGMIFFIAALVVLSKGLKKFFRTRSEERLKRFSVELVIIFLPMILFWSGIVVYAIGNILLTQTKIIFQQTTLGRNIFQCIAAYETL